MLELGFYKLTKSAGYYVESIAAVKYKLRVRVQFLRTITKHVKQAKAYVSSEFQNLF